MDVNFFRQFSMFAGLPEHEIQSLAVSLEERDFQAGEILFTEASLSKFFYMIFEGEVEIVKALGTDDERVIALSKKGSILGEMSMFSRNGTHTASARARSPLRAYRMSFVQFDALLNRNPGLAYNLLRLYSSRIEESENLTIRDLREKNRQLTEAYIELQAAQAAMIEKEKLVHELQIAAEIQRSILPEELPVCPGLDFGAMMIPARQVGGDFYDFMELDDHHLGILVGDVCDKGMAAALFMALTYSSARIEAFHSDTPGEVLRALNRNLMQINRSSMYVTLLYGILDTRTGMFQYARAGHPAPLFFDKTYKSSRIQAKLGQPIGLFDNPALDEQSAVIPPGGLVLVFSDGLSETIENQPNAPLLPDLCSDILSRQEWSAQGFCDQLWKKVGTSSSDPSLLDDFTVVAIKNLG